MLLNWGVKRSIRRFIKREKFFYYGVRAGNACVLREVIREVLGAAITVAVYIGKSV